MQQFTHHNIFMKRCLRICFITKMNLTSKKDARCNFQTCIKGRSFFGKVSLNNSTFNNNEQVCPLANFGFGFGDASR